MRPLDRPRRALSRRHFLSACAGGLLGAGDARIRAQAAPFRGTRPGDARIVDNIEVRWCPPGGFMMGSPPTEPGHRPDEAQVDVTITRGFWMAAREATQSEWSRIVGAFPYRKPSEQFGIGDDVPVYWVNYAEAELFCARLTARAHERLAMPPGWAFRLPTEAQWEYACRAGTTTATAFGASLQPGQANFDWGTPDSGPRRPPLRRSASVGSYPPNGWGLCDMHGNIFEWCRDWYHARLPGGDDPDLSTTRGTANRDGSYSRCRRGGAWNDPAPFCRSAFRLRYEPERRSDHIGFRVAAVEL